MSSFPSFQLTKAIDFPSGERDGEVSTPGKYVTCMYRDGWPEATLPRPAVTRPTTKAAAARTRMPAAAPAAISPPRVAKGAATASLMRGDEDPDSDSRSKIRSWAD